MESLKKQIIQDPKDGRGVKWDDHDYIMNHPNEITFDVVKGESSFNYYKRLAPVIKFATWEDAMDYINELGATEGVELNKPYYAVSKADGCAFSMTNFFSIKTDFCKNCINDYDDKQMCHFCKNGSHQTLGQ